MLYLRKYTTFRGFDKKFPHVGPIQGNVIGSHHVLFVAWVSTDPIGIVISRTYGAEVVKKNVKMLNIRKYTTFGGF